MENLFQSGKNYFRIRNIKSNLTLPQNNFFKNRDVISIGQKILQGKGI